MKITVINGAPAGENSITLQTVLFLEKRFSKCEFRYLHVGAAIRRYEQDFTEAREALEEADMLLFAYPVYTFLVPSQLHRFIELMKENAAAGRLDIEGKYTTQITTSKHFYDITAHRFIQENCDDLGLKSIRGLSADMEDLLHKQGQTEAVAFWRHAIYCVRREIFEPLVYPDRAGLDLAQKNDNQQDTSDCENSDNQQDTSDSENSENPNVGVTSAGNSNQDCTTTDTTANSKETTINSDTTSALKSHRIVIVTDLGNNHDAEHESLRGMIDLLGREVRAQSRSGHAFTADVVDLAEFPFKGGCLGCFHCAGSGKCVYQDHFDDFLRDNIQKSDAIVYAFAIRDHSMGYRFKLYDDRQFCNGHRTVTMGRPQGYLVVGDYSHEENVRTLLTARAQVGGNYLAGVAAESTQIHQLAGNLTYAIVHRYNQPADFYGVGGMKIFRDLIWQMQGMMREDHKFYREHGFYDFPQKKVGTMLGMYLVGTMMRSEKLQKKIGGHMTEGMLMPYKKVVEQDRAE